MTIQRAETPGTPTGRIPELDGLRAVAVLMILVKHSDFGVESGARYVSMLILGVDLFFVLSGFLITRIILANEAEPHFYRNFYARRCLRILPIYYLFLATAYALGLDGRAIPRIPPGEMARMATFTQCLPFVDRIRPSTDAVAMTWSLAIEEQFYLLWPPLILGLGRRGVALVSLGMIGLAVASRAIDGRVMHLAGRCDGLAIGGLLALLLDAARRRPRLARRLVPGLLAAAAAGLALPVASRLAARSISKSRPPLDLGLAVFSLDMLAFGVLVACAIGLAACRPGMAAFAPLRVPAVRYVGKISYGIYLYHTLVFLVLRRALGLGTTSTPWGTLLGFAAAVAVASASWHFIESPILKLKDRFEYRPGRGVPAIAGATSPHPPARSPEGGGATVEAP